ncbi:MAG: Calx-beta domain-containing protein, partial [Acidobacteriota bacterium]
MNAHTTVNASANVDSLARASSNKPGRMGVLHALTFVAAVLFVASPSFADTIQFAPSSYTVAESVGTVPITLTRSGTGVGSHTVSYATSDGTAFAGSDYVTKNGTVTWSDGDLSTKTISITINNDTRDEPDETFSVNLSNPTSGNGA